MPNMPSTSTQASSNVQQSPLQHMPRIFIVAVMVHVWGIPSPHIGSWRTPVLPCCVLFHLVW